MDALNAALKITLLLGDRRCQQEVPNRMPTCRSTFRREAMLEKRARRRFCICKGNQAISKITNRWDSELFAENPRGAPIITERDDCGECNSLSLKAAERSGHPRPTAEHHDTAILTVQTSPLQRAPETGAQPHRLALREIAMLHHNRRGAYDRRQGSRERLNNGNGSMPTPSATNRNTQSPTAVRQIGGHACGKIVLY